MNVHSKTILFISNRRHYNVIRTYRLLAIQLLVLSVIIAKCDGSNEIKRNIPKSEFLLDTDDKQRNEQPRYLSNEQPFSKIEIDSRSKRHRRNPSPHPLAEVLGSSSLNSGSTLRIAQEQVQNSHKPIFERCDEYQPSVEEESARGKNRILITPYRGYPRNKRTN